MEVREIYWDIVCVSGGGLLEPAKMLALKKLHPNIILHTESIHYLYTKSLITEKNGFLQQWPMYTFTFPKVIDLEETY